MKKILAYYLLLLYTASLCKPFTIWFSDAIAHVYFSRNHAEFHKHDGESHVHDEIGKAAKNDSPEQRNSTVKAQEEYSFAHNLTYSISPSPAVVAVYRQVCDDDLPLVFVDILSPPPRVS